MIVRLRDGTEFYATKDQAEQLWQSKINGQAWQFGDYRGDANAILLIKPGGQPVATYKGVPLVAAPQRRRASAATVASVREVLQAKGIVKPKIGARP